MNEPTLVDTTVRQSITIYLSEIGYLERPLSGELRGTTGFSFMFGDMCDGDEPEAEFDAALEWLTSTVRLWWEGYKKEWEEERQAEGGETE